MDKLGERIIRDELKIRAMYISAERMELEARRLRREADEMKRVLELARIQG